MSTSPSAPAAPVINNNTILSKTEAAELGISHFHREGRSHLYLVKPDAPVAQPFKKFRTYGVSGEVAKMISCTCLDSTYVWNDAPIEASAQEAIALKLRESLSQVLSSFPMLAGRLTDGGSEVLCSGRGITFRVQRVEGKAEWLDRDPKRGTFCDLSLGTQKLLGWHPLCSVVVTFFDKGGMVLGVTVSHSICDARSVLTFLQAWSKIHQGGELDYTPVFDYPSPPEYPQTLFTEQECEQAARERGWKDVPGWLTWLIMMGLREHFKSTIEDVPQFDRETLVFKREEVDLMKKSVSEKMKEFGRPEEDCWVSSSEALNAYVQQEMIRLLDFEWLRSPSEDRGTISTTVSTASINQNGGGDQEGRELQAPGESTPTIVEPIWKSAVLPVDLRGRFGFPKDFFGNLLGMVTVDMRFEKKWQEVAIEIHDKTRALFSSPEKCLAHAPLWNSITHHNKLFWDPKLPIASSPGCLGSWNWQAGMDFIGAVDFGNGTPSRAIPWSVGEPVKIIKNVDGDFEVHILSTTKIYFSKSNQSISSYGNYHVI